ncbi:MAG: IS66 family insertion sequence element accessory protein TnpA [Oscillospiraceae bacterium]
MGTEIQTVKNQMTLQNWAQEVAECQSSGMTVSAWCELHRINIKTYYDHLRQIRESLLTENCVVLLSTKSISDNIEIFSGDMRIKPAVFHLTERSRLQCCAYSIINTAQANGIDVREYLTTIFRTGERRLPLKSE